VVRNPIAAVDVVVNDASRQWQEIRLSVVYRNHNTSKAPQ